MKPKHIVIAFLAVVAALSCALSLLDSRGVREPQIMQLVSMLIFSALTFAWFWLDSEARSYRRSPFLSVAIVAFGVLAVPYYLVRSRPSGERLRAIGGYLGFFLLLVGALFIGDLFASALAFLIS